MTMSHRPPSYDDLMRASRRHFLGASALGLGALAMGDVLARHGVVGFCTYGEQWNSVHLNQTFTGLVLGGFHG